MSHVARSSCAPVTDLRLLGRHQIAAAIATSADFATMVAIVELAGVPPPLATLPSAIAGGLVNLTVARAWSFRQRHRGTIGTQAVRYATVSLGGALVNAAFLAALLNVADVPYPAARAAVAIVVSLLYTYPLHTRFVFRVGRMEGEVEP